MKFQKDRKILQLLRKEIKKKNQKTKQKVFHRKDQG